MKIESSMKISLVDVARELKNVLGPILASFPKGLYLPGRSTPLIYAGQEYVQSVRGKPVILSGEKLINNPGSIVADVYTTTGALIIPKQGIKLLRTEPGMEVNVTELILDLMDSRLKKQFKFTKHHDMDLAVIIRRYIVDQPYTEDMMEAIIDEVNRITWPIVESINIFVNREQYKMHVASLEGSDLVVRKHLDYRIHFFNEYHKLFKEFHRNCETDDVEQDIDMHVNEEDMKLVGLANIFGVDTSKETRIIKFISWFKYQLTPTIVNHLRNLRV